jgi:hypothetical protein
MRVVQPHVVAERVEHMSGSTSMLGTLPLTLSDTLDCRFDYLRHPQVVVQQWRRPSACQSLQ